MSREDLIAKAEVISAVRDYENEGPRRKKRIVDFTVSPPESDDRILMRVITETKSKSGYIGVDAVKEMNDILEKKDYDKGILVGNRFTQTAKREMKRQNIEAVSERNPFLFKLDQLSSTINNCVQKLCKIKCGKIPTKKSDCKGYVDGHYSCDVRLISDNADFHHGCSWMGFLERDLAKLLGIHKTLDD